MRTVDDVRALAASRYRSRKGEWLASDDPASEEWTLPLHPPTEHEVIVDPDGASRWLASWRSVERRSGLTVTWERRRWATLGPQSVPVRLSVAGVPPVATLAGRADEWARLTAYAGSLRADWPGAAYLSDGLGASAGRLAKLSPKELERLTTVTGWLLSNPHAHLRPRELPIPGVDTKWLERHRRLVDSLVAAISGSAGADLISEAQRFRVRVLDDALAEVGGLRDLTATVEELDRWGVSPRRVLIVENLASLASLPPMAGTIAVHGRGYAVTQLARISWVAKNPVTYWGDLDSHGFAILGRCRDVLPQTRSVLMDRSTLREHADLTVPEPSPYRASVAGLTAEEAATLSLLREHDLRLEQERLDLRGAHSALLSNLTSG
ncbi:Wadjet anti-phage system protein JetD domain-containing protein [Mariniluteicoccus flavus]